MKIKAIAALLAVLLLTGCSAGASMENLLTPPKLDAQQNEIYQALINSVGSSIQLKYPKGGDYRSAFVVRNIDDEDGEEALVFYESDSVQTGEGALRLKVLDQHNGKWQVVYDLACIGSEVDSISFTSIGTGSSIDILIRYSMLNQTEKSFSVLNYSDGIMRELCAASYSCLEVFDLNSDGEDELVTVSTDKATGISMAAMYSRVDGSFQKISEAELVGAHAEITGVTKGLLAENVPALFLDYTRSQGVYGTDVIYCRANGIVSPDGVGVDADSGIVSRFTNNYMADVSCYDIDGDGYLEIPSMTALPGYETLPRAEQLCAVQWYTVKDNSLVAEHYGYYSSKYGFALLFPNRWRGVVTAVPDIQNNEIIFIGYDNRYGLEVNSSTELMRIRIIDRNDLQAMNAAASLKVLGSNDECVYCYSETDGYRTGKLALSEDELKNSFIIL